MTLISRLLAGRRRLASDARELALEAPDPGTPRPGLVQLGWTLPAPLPGGWLTVSAKGVAPSRVALPPTESSGLIVLHGHLLDDGRHRVGVEAFDADGRRVARAERELAFSNPGALGEAVRRSLRARGTPFAVAVCDAALYDYADESIQPWFDRPDADATIAAWAAEGRIAAAEAEALRCFVRDGYVRLQGAIEPDLVRAVNAEIDDAVGRKWQGYQWGSSQRIEHLHEHYAAIRKLWLHERVMRMLALIFQARPLPCQTLTYVFGSQQDAHQDTIHLTPFPAGYMCGVWVALEDVQPDSGELMVWTGSHRLPRVRLHETGCAKVEGDWSEFGARVLPVWRRMIEEGRFETMLYRPKAGDVLIWHENLMHAGTPRLDPNRSRRSIVSHVFAEGALAYYDSTGKPGYMEPLPARAKAA